MFSLSEIPQTASTLFSAYSTLAGSMMLLRSFANELIPQQLRSYLCTTFYHYLFNPLSNNLTLVFDEWSGMSRNQVFDAAELYLRTKINPDTERLKVSKTSRQKNFTVSIEKGEEVTDSFQNVQLQWKFVCKEPQNNHSGEKRYFELSFHQKHKQTVICYYLPHVVERANEIKQEEKVVKLYNRECPYDDDDDGGGGGGMWGSINLEHPSTFDTLAMDPELKQMILDDLDRFLRRKEFYRRVGKAWKRGYLLYGPPGTGKSSLIAAMANYLSVEMKDRQNDGASVGSNTKLTLSGILNFIDGLWSSCGDERIIVFTTNHKERIDPALLRPGRMDVHINMSYCTVHGFKVLASNYLGIKGKSHSLFGEIEGLIQSTDVTPAEVAEELMKADDADVALEGLVNFLKRKRIQADESKNNDVKGEEANEVEHEKAKQLKTG
ncbi:AAA-ATPase [Citrus sinensis]|uniref:AAA-ATPase n=1 Tax=Citrus sinensis TaxID=2711 RepID=A0ACB8J2W8_CITSI|nr:AAA-ATPase [Citrus sinensis]